MAKGKKTKGTASESPAKVAARAALAAYFSTFAQGVDDGGAIGTRVSVHQPQPDQWTMGIVGSSDQVVNVELILGEYTLQMMHFFMRAPDENVTAVYRLLLRRNLEVSGAKFGVDEFGDIFLRMDLPVSAIDETEIDRAVGIFYACADRNWQQVMRLGFKSALA